MFKYNIFCIFLISSLLAQFILYETVSAAPIIVLDKTRVNPASNASGKRNEKTRSAVKIRPTKNPGGQSTDINV